MATLIIKLRYEGSDQALALFPLMDDQVFAGETYDGAAEIDTVNVEIDLADRADTTAAQEQFLDTNPAVISYEVVL